MGWSYEDMDQYRRSQMEKASNNLLAALRREHPRIMAHLRAKQPAERSK